MVSTNLHDLEEVTADVLPDGCLILTLRDAHDNTVTIFVHSEDQIVMLEDGVTCLWEKVGRLYS